MDIEKTPPEGGKSKARKQDVPEYIRILERLKKEVKAEVEKDLRAFRKQG